MSNIPTNPSGSLHRALNYRDLVFLFITCIVSLSSMAQVAQFGYGSLLLFLVAVFTYLIPSGITVAELNARLPAEGGFYVWVREAVGDLHAYVSAWCYWLSNIVWLPTVMLLLSATALYLGGPDWMTLADQPLYNLIVCLVCLWAVTFLNIIGLERAKWIQNIGGVAIWLCLLFLVVTGLWFASQYGSAHAFSWSKLVPDFSDLSLLPFFAIVAFCFGGLELGPVMGGEIIRPERNIPRALLTASLGVAVIYMLGTLMLIFAVPEGELGIIDGVAQAFFVMAQQAGIPAIGTLGAVLVLLSTLGLFGASFLLIGLGLIVYFLKKKSH